MVNYTCERCNKTFRQKCHYIDHTEHKKKPCKSQQNETSIKPLNNSIMNTNICKYCNKMLSRYDNLKRHIVTCKVKKLKEEEKENKENIMNNQIQKLSDANKRLLETNKKIIKINQDYKNDILELEKKVNQVILMKLEDTDKNFEIIKDNMVKIGDTFPINNQLVNIIVDKHNKIEELIKAQPLEDNSNKIIKPVDYSSLTLNNVVIVSREKDNYINATQLCKAGGKKFSHWISLDTTKELIKILDTDAGITASARDTLVDINKGGNNKNEQSTWIHPDLAIQLAQWISPTFALQVSKWIRTLFTDGKVEVTKKLLDNIKEKDNKIKLLQDTYVKKQRRTDYPCNNVIYILTTEEGKHKRNYIIGKAKNLKNRLSTYNKTSEHEVVYYKECKNEEDMNMIELMVINKLQDYKEKANRDRFILPIEVDITLFTNTIDECVKFINK